MAKVDTYAALVAAQAAYLEARVVERLVVLKVKAAKREHDQALVERTRTYEASGKAAAAHAAALEAHIDAMAGADPRNDD